MAQCLSPVRTPSLRTIAVVRQGRLPIRIRNLHDFPVSIGRYQKLGKLFKVNESDIHGARDISLTPGTDGVVEVGLVDVCDGLEEEQEFEVLKLADRPDLSPEEQGHLAALLQKWEKVFSTHDEDFGIHFKTLVLAYHAVNGSGPSYI